MASPAWQYALTPALWAHCQTVKGAGCKFESAIYPSWFVCELKWTLSPRWLKGPERG